MRSSRSDVDPHCASLFVFLQLLFFCTLCIKTSCVWPMLLYKLWAYMKSHLHSDTQMQMEGLFYKNLDSCSSLLERQNCKHISRDSWRTKIKFLQKKQQQIFSWRKTQNFVYFLKWIYLQGQSAKVKNFLTKWFGDKMRGLRRHGQFKVLRWTLLQKVIFLHRYPLVESPPITTI